MKSRPSLLRKTNPKICAATLCLVFIATFLGGPDLDAQTSTIFSKQPDDVTIKPGEAAFVEARTFNFRWSVKIYRIVPPDTPELFGELVSTGDVWILPETERRRYVDSPSGRGPMAQT